MNRAIASGRERRGKNWPDWHYVHSGPGVAGGERFLYKIISLLT